MSKNRVKLKEIKEEIKREQVAGEGRRRLILLLEIVEELMDEVDAIKKGQNNSFDNFPGM